MKSTYTKSLILLVAIFLSACSTRKAWTVDDSHSFSRSEAATQTFDISYSQTVTLYDFQNTFESAYGTNEDFMRAMANNLRDYISKNNSGDHKVRTDGTTHLMTEDVADLVLHIDHVTIDEKIENNTFNNMNNQTFNTPGGTHTTNSPETFCVIDVQVSVYNKKGQRVFAYGVRDQAKVSMFFFETALNNAMENAVEAAGDVILNKQELKGWGPE